MFTLPQPTPHKLVRYWVIFLPMFWYATVVIASISYILGFISGVFILCHWCVCQLSTLLPNSLNSVASQYFEMPINIHYSCFRNFLKFYTIDIFPSHEPRNYFKFWKIFFLCRSWFQNLIWANHIFCNIEFYNLLTTLCFHLSYIIGFVGFYTLIADP